MYTTLFFVILIILVADFMLERFVGYLNTTSQTDEIPGEMKDYYDAGQYARQQAYQRTNYRFGLIASGFSFLLIIAMLVFFGFAWLNNFVAGITAQPVWQALLFFGILAIVSDIVSLPFNIYHTFVIEEKFGFNKTTVKTYITDRIKEGLLSLVVGGAILALIVWIYGATGRYFWLIAWGVLAAFSLFMSLFYSSLIVPLFNKQTPLEEGELRNAIQQFAGKTGFKLDNIFVIDGSKRSTKANAYFTGLGPKKRIVLYDTLISEMTVDEIVAVLAHEIGHYKKKHIIVSLILSLLQMAVLLFLFSLVSQSPAVGKALGVETPNFHIGLLAFAILYSPVSMVVGIFLQMISRRNEFQADAFAAVNYKPEPLITALKKLAVKNLSNLTPHPAYVFFNYSHPPLLKRIEYLRKFE